MAYNHELTVRSWTNSAIVKSLNKSERKLRDWCRRKAGIIEDIYNKHIGVADADVVAHGGVSMRSMQKTFLEQEGSTG
jgi:hypothetical protein